MSERTGVVADVIEIGVHLFPMTHHLLPHAAPTTCGRYPVVQKVTNYLGIHWIYERSSPVFGLEHARLMGCERSARSRSPCSSAHQRVARDFIIATLRANSAASSRGPSSANAVAKAS